MTFNSLPEHMEGFLGPVSEGWSEATREFTKVLRFDDQPEYFISTYATLGLREYELDLKNGKTIRQELLLSAHASFQTTRLLVFCFIARNV